MNINSLIANTIPSYKRASNQPFQFLRNPKLKAWVNKEGKKVQFTISQGKSLSNHWPFWCEHNPKLKASLNILRDHGGPWETHGWHFHTCGSWSAPLFLLFDARGISNKTVGNPVAKPLHLSPQHLSPWHFLPLTITPFAITYLTITSFTMTSRFLSPVHLLYHKMCFIFQLCLIVFIYAI